VEKKEKVAKATEAGTYRTWSEPTLKTGYLESYSFEDILASALKSNIKDNYPRINHEILKPYGVDQILNLYFIPPVNPKSTKHIRENTFGYLKVMYSRPYRPARTLFHIRLALDLKKRRNNGQLNIADTIAVMRIICGEMRNSAITECFLSREKWFNLMDQIKLRPNQGHEFKSLQATAISHGMKE